jgi:hypothetical protein
MPQTQQCLAPLAVANGISDGSVKLPHAATFLMSMETIRLVDLSRALNSVQDAVCPACRNGKERGDTGATSNQRVQSSC